MYVSQRMPMNHIIIYHVHSITTNDLILYRLPG